MVFAICFIKFGLEWKTLFAIVFVSCVLIMTMTDIKEKLVDCNIAIGLAVVGLLYNWLLNGTISDSIYGLLLGVVIIETIAWSGYFIKKTRALGEADTYVAGALGACFGLNGLLNVLIYSFCAAMVFIIPMFLYKQFKNGQKAICTLSIVFTLAILVYQTLVQSWYTFTFLALSGLALVISVLRSLRDEATPMYLPLVPAFAMGALYYLFFIWS